MKNIVANIPKGKNNSDLWKTKSSSESNFSGISTRWCGVFMLHSLYTTTTVCSAELERSMCPCPSSSTWPKRMNECGNLWPQPDPESIFSSVCWSRPHSSYQEEPACPWRKRCSITLCCSVSHMAEDAALHYSPSHWEGQKQQQLSNIGNRLPCMVWIQADAEKKIINGWG